MSLSRFLAEYGYLAVFVGSLLEGETILVLAGYAAHQGYLSWTWVVLLAFAGGTLGDQVYFFLGRRYGAVLLRRYPRLEARAERVNRLVLRFHEGLVVAVRFMYGLRILGPVLIGMSGLAPWRFALFNAVGAALWAVGVTSIGFLFGHAVQGVMAHADRYEAVALLALAAIGLLYGLVRWAAKAAAGSRR